MNKLGIVIAFLVMLSVPINATASEIDYTTVVLVDSVMSVPVAAMAAEQAPAPAGDATLPEDEVIKHDIAKNAINNVRA
jgi:hypothetical protein